MQDFFQRYTHRPLDDYLEHRRRIFLGGCEEWGHAPSGNFKIEGSEEPSPAFSAENFPQINM